MVKLCVIFFFHGKVVCNWFSSMAKLCVIVFYSHNLAIEKKPITHNFAIVER